MSLLGAQRYALRRAVAMVAARPAAFVLSVVLAASALTIPLALASLAWATWPVLAKARPAAEFSVFVATSATAREVDSLKSRLAQLPGVTSVTLRPKDAALAELTRRSGFAVEPGELGFNPLPDALIVRYGPNVRTAVIEADARAIRGWPLVDAVRADLDWYIRLRALARVFVVGAAVFGGLVVVLVALILAGTVRLHAVTRTEEVALLRLVGATSRFIVRPYAYSAVVTLLCAAAIAVAAVYGIHFVLRTPIEQLTALYGSGFRLPDPEPLHAAAVLLAATVFGWLVGVVGARTAIGGR